MLQAALLRGFGSFYLLFELAELVFNMEYINEDARFAKAPTPLSRY
jgi:hypothetical protein